MKMDAQSGIVTYRDVIRGLVSPDEYAAAVVLVEEVKEYCQKVSDNVDSDQLYVALLEFADKLGIKNPFHNKEDFLLVYKKSEELEYVEWEDVIVHMASTSRMPLIPKVLLDVYQERFSIGPETILVAEAEKFAPNLKSMVDENINSKFVLTTQNTIYARILENLFDGNDHVEICVTNIYSYEFISQRFDLILACPGFGRRMLSDDPNFMCREFDMVALENLSLHLNGGGRLVLVLPGRITFASGRVSDLRQFIQTTYTIKEIGELPEGTIEYSGIKVYLLDIENNRPHDDNDIVIRRYSSAEKKSRRASVTSLEVTDDTFVMLSELEEQGDWNIDQIFAQQDTDYQNYQRSGIRKDIIGNVAEVFRGKAVTKKDPAGDIGVVNISNIGEYEIDYSGLEHLQEEERKVSNYLLQEGDVVLPARGTAIRTAVFHKQGYPCIASSNLIVIRPNPKMLDSVYLKIFLDSPIGNKMISSAQQGAGVMNISYKDLRVLEVPIPPMETQQAVTKEYLEELQNYRETVAAAERRWAEVLTRLQTF